MDEQSILALKNNNLLKDADFSKLNLDQIKGRVHTISLGEVLFKEGDSANSMYLVLDGEINLLDKKNYGKSKSVIFSKGDFFGAKELIENVQRSSTSISLMDSKLIEFSKEEIEFLAQQDNAISNNLNNSIDDDIISNSFDSLDAKDDFNEPEYFNEIESEFISDKNIDSMLSDIDELEDSNYSDDSLINEELSNHAQKFEEIIDDENNQYHLEIESNLISKINDSQINSESEKSEAEDNISKSFMTSEQFEMIVKALQLLNANVKLNDVLKNIVDVAVSLTNADRGTLYLVDNAKQEIWSKILIGNEIEEIRLNIGEGLAGWVAKTGETLNIKDVNNDNRFNREIDVVTGYETKNMLVYPIKNKTDEIVGVLQLLNNSRGYFSHQEEMFLNAISLNASIALESSSLVEKLITAERKTSLDKMGNFLGSDIKKPILVSRRYVQHLLKKDLPFDAKQILNLLYEQLDHVANQVETTADYTEGTILLRKQWLSLNDTLQEYVININSLLNLKNCRVVHDFSDDAEIYIDKKEFYQCYYHIIKNACEALPNGGNISISTKIKDETVIIYFEDKGIGINKSDLNKVFEPFWTKNKENGSGLGLAISKKIIEDLNGNIEIISEKNIGTTVIISMPIR